MATDNVCGVPMGGEPGEAPTLMIGTIFYDGHDIVKDQLKGAFDKSKAKDLIDLQAHWSEVTGLPCCLDVVASTEQAMENYLEFVVDEFDGPIMVDGSDAKVKMAGMRYLASKKLSDKVIYNSVSQETTDLELETIQECGVKVVIALVMNSLDFSAEGKMKLVTDENGPVTRAKKYGVEKILIDPGVIDLPSIGTVKEVMEKVGKLGYLTGSGVHNALSNWKGLKTKIGKDFKPAAKAVVNALSTAWSGDFVLYGPISDAPIVFPAVAMVDAILAQTRLEKGEAPDMSHPLFKIA
ncbi:N5-methyltetrahydromethanopterin:coenzyme M methyltransferase subunit H [hydrothermal vent metagenome]|uniref:N5-methyltetrahydromethanopterin:coenzyme M methyltransferase subunit H n=1 Tax=hydrothermal vent metagenome TaxID=652676 RepID=A0A3B1BZT3_9ZZZZ